MTGRVGSKQSLHRLVYLRDLLYELVVRDIKLRYKRSVVGIAWSLLVPLAQLAVLSFVFGVVLKMRADHFSTFLFSGLLPWTWFSSSLMGATRIAGQNKDLLRQVGFPAGILPAITVTSQFVHFVVALPILFGFLMYDGRPVTWALAILPLVMILQFVLNLALSYFVAPLQVLFHDTEHLLGVSLMLMFYLSPIFYEPSAVPGRYAFVYNLNPMVHLLNGYRAPLIDGQLPAMGPLLMVGAASLGLLAAGYTFYKWLHYRIMQEL
ncbi:MAG: ABC transporter permease [Planctomycetaceae bacterium]|nr:ABC transporter permease [Planctomycetaceae bacterium]